MKYSKKFISLIIFKNDIVDVVSEYTDLKKTGKLYLGICPFHNEKAPSFFVDKWKKTFRCYGCGKSGNVIDFIMEIDKCSFETAVNKLCKRAGLDLPRFKKTVNIKEETILKINFEAAKFYYKKLYASKNNGLEYFKEKRHLSDDIMKRFGLGMSGNFGSELYSHLKAMGFSDQDINDSGLVFRNDDKKGEPFCDKFWDRAMFPIMDKDGKTVGFGGRVLGDKKPKYLNSPETVVFDKSNLLYGFHLARHSKRDGIILCEGNVDVITLHQFGFTNSVASLGTALTKQQVRMIKERTDKVFLAYDSDEAGTKAALRAIDICNADGLEVKIISMAPYKDPDEFLNNLGAEEFQKRIDNAEDSKRFQIQKMKLFAETESEYYSDAVKILI